MSSEADAPASLTARWALEEFVEEIAMGVGPSPRDISAYVDAVVRAELAEEIHRMADKVEASETDNLWGRRELRFHADEIEKGGRLR